MNEVQKKGNNETYRNEYKHPFTGANFHKQWQ